MMNASNIDLQNAIILREKKTPHVRRGAVVIQDRDVVHALVSSKRQHFCDGCLSSGNLKPCERCGQMYYCSKSCEASMHQIHRFECTQYVALQRLPIANIRLLLRLIMLEDTEHRQAVATMMSHAEDFKTDSEFMSNFAVTLQTLASFMGGQLPVSERDIFILYCQVHINSFVITDSHGVDIAPGIFLKAARLDHSCLPNTEYIFNGRQILFLAVRDIQDETEARISYVDPLATTSQRRALLRKRYFFDCSCPVCMDVDRDREISSLMCCGSKPLSEPFPLDQSSPDCERKFRSRHIGSSVSIRRCPTCNVLYSDHLIDQLSRFLTSFTEQTPSVERAADAIRLYCRLRGLEILPDSATHRLSNEPKMDRFGPDYYRLFGNSAHNVLLARLCRMAGYGLWVENTDSVMNALAVTQGDDDLRDRVNRLLIASGIDYVEWQATWRAGSQFMVGLHAVDLAGFLLRWVTDQQFASDEYMRELLQLTASNTSIPNLGQFLCRLISIAEDKLNMFAPYDRCTAESLKRLRTFL